MTADIKRLPHYPSRSFSANLNRAQIRYYYESYPQNPIQQQQSNAVFQYPTYYYTSDGLRRPKYITEIYDKATNRYIPTTCCY